MPAIPISFDESGKIITVKVRKTEEKGSDVNLASYMVFDACRDDADLYVLVSNDSDFVATLTILSEELDKKWALLSPVERPNNRLLGLNPVFIKPIRRGAMLASQLPEEIRSPEHGILRRPDTWSLNETGAP
ncbi:NYN domain-containing protein [Leifsonia sp. SIMBA_070]|uniref:NYN domain-containing protein n=1 Tax=Leifsonia sp. SIMBA_070 TaxID=3085810 RepID=UPI00397B529A